MRAGDVFRDGLRDISVDNGIVRVKYGSRQLDFRDTGFNSNDGFVIHNTERHMDHFLEARHADAPTVTSEPWNGELRRATSTGCRAGRCHDGSGTHWHDAQYTWYGDGTTFSSATVNRDADRMRVLRADDDAIELSYEWDAIRLDASYNQNCILGHYPECGPTDRDSSGQAIYKHNAGDQVLSVKVVNLWKTIRIERCSAGYYVSLRSDPPLRFPEQGPRTVRLGYVSTVRAFSCNGLQATSHPRAEGNHFIFDPTDCIADIPTAQVLPPPEEHFGWPFSRFMVTGEQREFSSLQYSAEQLGSPGASDLPDTTGFDGRPKPWQAFIGAVPYISPDATLEPTPDLLQQIADQMNLLNWR